MDRKLLAACGSALYGERWQTDLARDLKVADRTMRRWVSGESDIPPSVAKDVHALLMARRVALDRLSRHTAFL